MKNVFLTISLALVTSTTAFAFDCANVLGTYSCVIDQKEHVAAVAIEKENFVTISFDDNIYLVMNKDGSKFEFRYGPIKFDTIATCNQDGSYHAEAWSLPTRWSTESEQLSSVDIANGTFTFTTMGTSDARTITCVKKYSLLNFCRA